VKRMKDIAKVQGGYAFDSKKFATSGKFQVVKMSNVYNGNLNLERSASYLNNLTRQEENFLLKRNDILITLTGTIGKRDYGYTYKINGEENLVLNQRVARVIAKDGVADPQYLAYELKTNRLLDQFFFSARGGTGNQANVGTGDLELVKVVTPSLPEQRKIATILSTWDEAITKTQQLIAQLQQRNKGLMQQLLKPKADWESVHLGDVLKRITNGITYDTDLKVGKPVSRIETISNGEIDFCKVGFCNKKNIEAFKMESGDILYSHINSLEHIGKVAFYDGKRELYHGMNLLLLRANEETLSKFLYYWLKSDFGKKQSKSFAKKAVNQASISSTEVKSFKISIPNKEVQLNIVEVLDASVSEVKLYEQKLAALQQQKKGLMQKLLTGEVRVEGFVLSFL